MDGKCQCKYGKDSTSGLGCTYYAYYVLPIKMLLLKEKKYIYQSFPPALNQDLFTNVACV